MKKVVIPFVIIITSLLILFRFGRYQIISGNVQTEWVVTIFGVVFFVLGVVIHKKYFRNETEESSHEIDTKKIEALDLRKRELEILVLIAQGFSNQEIGEKLFLSESTIKTHVSNILLKLNAKRRTEAVRIARELHLI